MNIPERFAELLARDNGLHGAVRTTLDRFGRWFADNKMVFFPGFTDHGTAHVESVMRGAEGLVRDEAWAVLTPEDAAIGLLSILLHDSAMHLSEDGFLRLISGSEPVRLRSYFFAEPVAWGSLWESFLA